MAPNLVCWWSLAISNYAKSQLSFQNGGCPDGESFYILELVYWMVVSNIFYFHPYLGKWSNFTHIFQMGWNHQLVYLLELYQVRCDQKKKTNQCESNLLPCCHYSNPTDSVKMYPAPNPRQGSVAISQPFTTTLGELWWSNSWFLIPNSQVMSWGERTQEPSRVYFF